MSGYNSFDRNLEGYNNHAMEEINHAFKYLKNKLDESIKKHFHDMHLAFKHGSVMYDGYGSLSYLNEPFYLVGPTNEYQNLTVAPYFLNQYLGYEFFMFRLINGQNSFNLEYDYKIVLDKQTYKSYQILDLVRMFEYLDANGRVTKHLLEGDTSMVSPVAAQILNQETNHLIDIIKSVFYDQRSRDSGSQPLCNKLKNIPDKDQLTSYFCRSLYKTEDTDTDTETNFFINFANCKEIFTLASNDKLCFNSADEIPDYLHDPDELYINNDDNITDDLDEL